MNDYSPQLLIPQDLSILSNFREIRIDNDIRPKYPERPVPLIGDYNNHLVELNSAGFFHILYIFFGWLVHSQDHIVILIKSNKV